MSEQQYPISESAERAVIIPSGQAEVNSVAISAAADNEELTAEEMVQVTDLAKKIDIDNDAFVSTFGAEAQAEIASFSRQAVGNTRVYELGDESQELIRSFKGQLALFKKTEDGPGGLFGFISKLRGELAWWLQKLEKLTTYVDNAQEQFRKQITELTVDLKTNDKAADVNYRNRRALLVHIRAGKIALAKARAEKLVELQAKANETKAPSDVERAKEFAKKCDEFEVKLGRLGTSLAITYIRKPQIDLLRDSERKSISLFQDFITQAIPLWLDEMRTTLNIKNVEQSNQMAAAAREMTEGLFMSNIEKLGQAAESTVKSAESGLIRTEVIIAGTDKLIASLDKIEAANDELIKNSRKDEKELLDNNMRISKHQLESI